MFSNCQSCEYLTQPPFRSGEGKEPINQSYDGGGGCEHFGRSRCHNTQSKFFLFASSGNGMSSSTPSVCLQIDSVAITKSLITTLASQSYFFRVKTSVNVEFWASGFYPLLTSMVSDSGGARQRQAKENACLCFHFPSLLFARLLSFSLLDILLLHKGIVSNYDGRCFDEIHGNAQPSKCRSNFNIPALITGTNLHKSPAFIAKADKEKTLLLLIGVRDVGLLLWPRL